MKYPIGIQSFDQIIEDGYVYVDKTGLIYQLVKRRENLFPEPPSSVRQEPAGLYLEMLFPRAERTVQGACY